MFPYSQTLNRFFLLGLLTIGFMLPFVPNAQSQSRTGRLSSKISNTWQFKPPSRLGIPTGREGGATRGCKTEGNLFPIVPNPVKALTISSTPTLYWYLPPTEAMAVEFSLRDDQDQEVYKTQFILAETNQSGQVMGLQLPNSETFSGLELSREYVWEVVLICDLDNPTKEKGTIGIIERIEPSQELNTNLVNATLEEQLALYFDTGLWYETVDTLVNLNRENPQNQEVTETWKKLMRSVNLPEVMLN
jgi:hypothetical protein